jgi:serine/threonine protein kinase
MGDVYLAKHRQTRTRCALKVIRADKQEDRMAPSRFRAEIRALKSLKHAHIVRFLGAGRTDDGLACYVMEYLPGTNLDQFVERGWPVVAASEGDRIVNAAGLIGGAGQELSAGSNFRTRSKARRTLRSCRPSDFLR